MPETIFSRKPNHDALFPLHKLKHVSLSTMEEAISRTLNELVGNESPKYIANITSLEFTETGVGSLAIAMKVRTEWFFAEGESPAQEEQVKAEPST